MIPSLVVLAVVLGALLWLFGGREDPPEPTAHRRPTERDDIDRTELEQAERDVQDADDEDSVRDWGPGSSSPRPPHLL